MSRILFPWSATFLLGSLAVTASAADLTEGNAATWSTFASDGAATSLADDASMVKAGLSSLRFSTLSGFDTGVRYPASANWNYDATAFNHLVFWEYPQNNTPIGWQGNQPIIVIHTGSGTIRLEPNAQITPNHTWKLFKAPLEGGNGWTRTNTGAPDLGDVDQIEIHHDTWDYGFTIYFDGVQFLHLDPGSLPPPGPPPPPGVDPDVIEPRVLLYVYNPIMENFGGLRMNEVYGWADPVALADQVRSDLEASSHGRACYQIVETVVVDGYPRFEDGFQHTDETFAAAWAAHEFHPSTFDYVGFGQANGLGARVDAGELDEVWVYSQPIGGMWESAMAGQGAYWINGVAYPAAGGQRAFVIMGWNFERGVGEAIHSFGHRCESIMADKVYGQWCPSRCNTWSRFALLDSNQPGFGGVGNVHFPVNGESDYDYANARFVASNADAWLSYPNLHDDTRTFNFHEWSPAGLDPHREYLNWWYAHMPHVSGRAPDNYLANWWRYLLDVDQFKSGNASLYLTIGIPQVAIIEPAAGSVVSGMVTVRASADVDGALGRVDFYVDGVFVAADTLSPYRFEWDTSQAGFGLHQLVAKAYELQNGTEAVSAVVDVLVPCPVSVAGDADGDCDVDLGDWSVFAGCMLGPQMPVAGGCTPVDVDGDGDVDAWDAAAFQAALTPTR